MGGCEGCFKRDDKTVISSTTSNAITFSLVSRGNTYTRKLPATMLVGDMKEDHIAMLKRLYEIDEAGKTLDGLEGSLKKGETVLDDKKTL
ncbi:MAG: hypothetical protein V2I33_19235 [Kangiellaceae bacterium]|nr:hypothetical protein [Kangiellaceae bacterium]